MCSQRFWPLSALPVFPGRALIMLALVLGSAGLPLEGIALVAGVDRLLDMLRTTVNVTGDGAVAQVVDAMEKRKLAKGGRS